MANTEKQTSYNVWLMNLIKEECVTVRIVSEAGVDVTGFIASATPRTFQFSTTWGSVWDSMGRAIGMAGDLWNMLSVAKGGNLTQINLIAQKLTTATWKGGQRPAFSVGLVLINFDDGKDIQDDIDQLLSCVLPTSLGFSIFGSQFGLGYKAPLGYDASDKTTISVRIGNWFNAHGLLATNVNISYSETLGDNGKPLFCTVSLSLETWKLPYADEVKGWFRPNTAKNIGSGAGGLSQADITSKELWDRIGGGSEIPPGWMM